MPATPPDTITWLDAETVARLLPGYDAQVDLLEGLFLGAATGGVENPPKLGVHPRPDSFLHAMPAHVRDGDVTAMKWVAAYPGNTALGLPAITGLVVLNDSATGLPLAVLDAAALTATRTAAVSGVAIRHLAPEGWREVAILGHGAQGRAHVDVVRALRPRARIRVYAGPRRSVEAGAGTIAVGSAREAVEGAQVIITAGPMAADPARVLERRWVDPPALVLPIDFDAYVGADLVAGADTFVVDDVEQFEHHRSLGRFAGWPGPDDALGTVLDSPPTTGVTVVCSLGIGAADAVLADAVWQRAAAEGAGVPLSR